MEKSAREPDFFTLSRPPCQSLACSGVRVRGTTVAACVEKTSKKGANMPYVVAVLLVLVLVGGFLVFLRQIGALGETGHQGLSE